MYKITIAVLLSLLLFSQKPSTFDRRLATPVVSHQSSMMVGAVSVRKALNGNIVVIVDGSPDNTSKTLPDGTPDMVFRFASRTADTARYKDVFLDLKQAQVFFQPGRLAIVSDDHTVLSLSVEEPQKDDRSFAVYGDQSRDLPETVRLNQGIGLVRQMPKLLPDTSSAPVDLEADFVIRGPHVADESGGGCASGGKGASECSVSCPGGGGCGVTCGTGYWACCNCGGCTCVEKSLIDRPAKP